MQGKLLTVDDLAGFLSLSRPAVYALVYRRQVPFLKLGRRLRFDAELLKWFDAQNVEIDRQGGVKLMALKFPSNLEKSSSTSP